jgi:tetratricopeptide (TPR) repeat protein
MTRFQKWFFKEFQSPFLHGIAFKKFERRNYKKAAELLENLCRYNEDEENREYTYRTLGHCYLCMGKINSAIKWLSKSYDIYQTNIISKQDSTYLRCYGELVDIYCYALERSGKKEIAKIIKLNYNKEQLTMQMKLT